MSSAHQPVLEMRQRTPWEALDAGVLLWRSNFTAICAVLLFPVLMSVSVVLLLPDLFWLWFLLIWWTKPLWDRFYLLVVSRRFFDPAIPVQRILKNLPGFLFRRLIGDLLWRRFSPGRITTMSIAMLERKKGQAGKARKKALAAGGQDFGLVLASQSLFLEYALLSGELSFIVTMIQIFNPQLLATLTEHSQLVILILYVLFSLNIIIVEPLYCCMGFANYINSRMQIEGWDLQMDVNRFARKRQSSVLKPGLLKPLVLCLLIGIGPGTRTLLSAESIRTPAQAYPAESLHRVLESPDFGGEYERRVIRLKEREPAEPEFQMPELPNTSWLQNLFSYFLTALLVVCAVFLLIILIRYVYLRLDPLIRGRKKEAYRILGHEDSTMLSARLLLDKARNELEQGRIRSAWAFLIKAATALLIETSGTQAPDHATEQELIRIFEKTGGSYWPDYAALMQKWIAIAYAGARPETEALQQGISWCRSIAAEDGDRA